MTPASLAAFVDLESGAVRAATTGNAAPTLRAILRTRLSLKVGFMTDGTCEALPVGTTGRLVIKKSDDPDGDALVLDTSFDASGSGADARYTFLGLVDSDALRTALGDASEMEFTAQILFELPGEDDPSSSEPFTITIVNNWNRADLAPITTPYARGLAWLSGLTGLTGGGASKLDGVLTADLSTGLLVVFCLAGDVQFWELVAGTTAEDAANGIVRPDDYDGTTNTQIWLRRL